MLVILGIIVVIIVIIIIAVAQSKKAPVTPNNNQAGTTPTAEQATTSPQGNIPTTTSTSSNAIEGVGTIVSLKDAVAIVPGPNLVTKDNKVVTAEGKVTANNAQPMAPDAPKQTSFLDKATLAPSVIQLSVGNNKFAPNEFTVKAGAPTTISITGVDSFSHVIAFNDSSLSAVAVLVGPGQTRGITFNAPVVKGTYTFRCDSPDHATRGETGKMIVN